MVLPLHLTAIPSPIRGHRPRRDYPEQEAEERRERRVHHHGDGVAVEGGVVEGSEFF